MQSNRPEYQSSTMDEALLRQCRFGHTYRLVRGMGGRKRRKQTAEISESSRWEPSAGPLPRGGGVVELCGRREMETTCGKTRKRWNICGNLDFVEICGTCGAHNLRPPPPALPQPCGSIHAGAETAPLGASV